jgi:hypothetical protein
VKAAPVSGARTHRNGLQLVVLAGAVGLPVCLTIPFLSVGANPRSVLGMVRTGTRIGQLGGLWTLLAALVFVGPVAAFAGAARLFQGGPGARALLLVGATVGCAVSLMTWVVVGPVLVTFVALGSAVSLAAGAMRATGKHVDAPAIQTRFLWALGIGAVFAISVVGLRVSSRSGAGNPNDAARAAVTAIASGDVLLLVENLEPAERDAVLGSGRSLLRQLRRLRVVGSPRRRTTPSVAVVRPSPKVALRGNDVAIADLRGALKVAASVDSLIGTRAANQADKVEQLVLVKTSGRWFVSLGATAAEAQRVRLNRQLSTESIEPQGQPHPEAAVRAFLRAIAEIDQVGMISILDPVEGATFYQYNNLYADEFTRLRNWSETNATLSFPNVGLTTARSGRTAQVRISRLSAELQLPSDLGTGSQVILDGNCIDATVERESSRHCGQDIPKVIADLFGVKAPEMGSLNWLEEPERQLSIAVVQREGKWFIAPIRTMIDTIALRLSTMKPDDFVGSGNTVSERVDAWMTDPFRALTVGSSS